MQTWLLLAWQTADQPKFVPQDMNAPLGTLYLILVFLLSFIWLFQGPLFAVILREGILVPGCGGCLMGGQNGKGTSHRVMFG